MSTESTGAAGAAIDTTTPPAAAGGTTEPTPGSLVPEFQNPALLQERLERHGRKVLKDALGVSTPEEAKALRVKLSAMEAAEVARAQAEMTEVQKAAAATDEAKAKVAQLANELATEKRNSAILTVLHDKGVKNTDYARFLLERDREAVGGGADFDYGAALSKSLGDPLTRAALGIVEGVSQPTTVTTPATTTPAGHTPPKAPTAGGTADGPKSAKAMTPDEWTAYKRSNGMF